MPKKKPFEDRNIRGDNKSFDFPFCSDLSLTLCKFEQIYLQKRSLLAGIDFHMHCHNTFHDILLPSSWEINLYKKSSVQLL